MAQSVLSLAPSFPEFEFVAQVSRGGEPGNNAVPGFSSLEAATAALDDLPELLIDFSLASATPLAAAWCGNHGVAMISGVTGIDTATHDALDEAGKHAPVLWAPNLSLGINLLAGMMQGLDQLLDPARPVTVCETHHRGKKDAPSGTALMLARQLRAPANGAPGTDPKRIEQDFPGFRFESIREGDVVGDHSVTLDLGDETLTLAHHAKDRGLFARGALNAARWLVKQPPGRYTAADWIRDVHTFATES